MTSAILMELGNLQQFCPQPTGTHNTIENDLVDPQRCCVSRNVRDNPMRSRGPPAQRPDGEFH